ncbi:glutaredoxin [Intrasporangium calvum]|nr:glutaredoxin [Intrasporangium calvum]
MKGRSHAPADVTIVTSAACHLCEDAVTELAGRRHELTLTVIAADTPDGLELVQRHRPVMFPLVLIDGAFLSSGRLPRRKLDKTLAARTRQAVSS